MENKFLTRVTLLLALVGSIGVQGEGEIQSDFEQLQPLENEVLERLIQKDDGPFERKIKELLAEYILATAVDSANNANIDESRDSVGRALQNYYPAPPPQQQQPQIVYVYATTPPPRNSNERTRRTKPPRTHRTRRPGHHHSSEEQRATQPPQQPVYIQQPYPPQQQAPAYPYPPQQQQQPYPPQYPPQNQPQYPTQQQPPYQPQPAYQQPQQQRPIDLPQDSITGQGQVPLQPPSNPSSPPQNPVPPTNNSAPTQQYPQGAPAQSPPQYQQPYPSQQSYPAPAQPQQPAAAPVQVVYIQATTLAPTGPTTTPRPRPSQQHVYNQVNNILDNVSRGNITGIVDQALGIRAPMPTRNFVNGILNTVFCNPINRLLGRCRG